MKIQSVIYEKKLKIEKKIFGSSSPGRRIFLEMLILSACQFAVICHCWFVDSGSTNLEPKGANGLTI